ncbi:MULTISPECIES: hypothetical protein [unclassified Maribacter]|uniref:hypothetical protein n=2 Tax=Maribacter TaxID=252356 RepID=UPI00257D7812|nr:MULTISPECIES: hypothetical protein [unclassified Maribacter]|tara:strand:- start:13757 stop:16153 length:2397 start_codon:yes stop_codon:yes gene_type:complete
MHRFLLLIVLFVSSNVVAQNDVGHKLVKDKFLNYFELPRESVFLHTNKTMYIVNEEVWLKGYVYNRHLQKPFHQTTTVHVGLFNAKGENFKNYHFKAKDGYFKGNIVVDSMLVSGEYYLRSSTNWMKNFKEDDSHIQKITILNEKPLKKESAVRDYDIQFLPEGGNLIEGTPSIMGVKVTDGNGYGVRIIEGSVFDDDNAQVARFYTSIFGLGKFNFIPKVGKNYIAKLEFSDGNVQTVTLQKPMKKGVAFGVKHIDDDRFIITLTTNETTKEITDNQQFYLLVHRDGHANRIPLAFPKNSLFVSKVLNKEVLNKGMNILTLFNSDGKPIAERLIFNYADLFDAKLEVSKLALETDSLKIQVKLLDTDVVQQNLSVSVLPGNTISHNQKNSIYSTFYLKPYIKGFIENPKYYFEDITTKKQNELDLLLMTQGWSRYDWNDIFRGPPNQFYEFENGIDLEGTLYGQEVSSNDKLLVSYPDNRSRYLDILDNKFLIPKYFPEKGDMLEFTLINNKTLRKPTVGINMVTAELPEKLDQIWNEKVIPKPEDFNENIKMSGLISDDNTINLNEVTVVEERMKTTVENNVFIPKYLKDKMTEVTEDIEVNFPLVSDIIRSRGYYVREELSFGSTDRVIIRIRTVQSFESKRAMPVPAIYLNNVRLNTFDLLYRMPTNEVESFLIDKTGAGEGVRGSGGVIRIYTRRLPRGYTDQGSSDNTIFKYEFKEGFEKVKKFYTPKYTSYFSNEFENFGTIHWVPELITNENGIATFKILNTFQSNVTFFIEGMGAKGQLISAERNLIIE